MLWHEILDDNYEADEEKSKFNCTISSESEVFQSIISLLFLSGYRPGFIYIWCITKNKTKQDKMPSTKFTADEKFVCAKY
jgi:hypothetical protein